MHLENRFPPAKKQYLWIGAVVLVVVVLLVIGIAVIAPPAKVPAPDPQAGRNYILPAQFIIDARAERGPEGEIYISGSTNFPSGMKMWIHVESGRLPLGAPKSVAWDDNVLIRDSRYRTAGLWLSVPNPNFRPEMKKRPDAAKLKFRQRPFPAGRYSVRFLAYFNSAWQSQDVLVALGGQGGKKLTGKLLKQTDPDVVDSDKNLDDVKILAFPPLSPEAEAISTVKAAVLTVPGKGRSATEIEENVDQFTDALGLQHGKGWSARQQDGRIYEVIFDYIEGKTGSKQAVWSVNLATKQVKYVNEAAKLFSWMPSY